MCLLFQMWERRVFPFLYFYVDHCLSLSLLITGRRTRAIRTRALVAFRRRHAGARRGRHARLVHVRRYCVVWC
jgi:hypothetical protein